MCAGTSSRLGCSVTGSCCSTACSATTPPVPRSRSSPPPEFQQDSLGIPFSAVRRKLIVASNRGPVSYGRDAQGARTAVRGGGGLVTALRGLVQYHDVTWIASAITEEDRAVAGETVEESMRDGS